MVLVVILHKQFCTMGFGSWETKFGRLVAKRAETWRGWGKTDDDGNDHTVEAFESHIREILRIFGPVLRELSVAAIFLGKLLTRRFE